ncbi:hypothetical protein D7I39_10900 [Allopusillimonas ginsengisoli]|nr:hypothetical protein D7I39_10900 [Allopusillimonas ginsengisoli]
MGLRDEIAQEVAAAFDDDLADAVKEFTGTRIIRRGRPNPVTEEWNSEILTYEGRGVFGSFQAELVDGNKILATDVKLLVLQVELLAKQAVASTVGEQIAPKIDDTIAGMKVMSVSRDPADVTWTVQLRKV